MSTLEQIRTAIADTIRDYVTGNGGEIYAYPYVQGTVDLPCAMVMPGGGGRDNKAGDFTMTMARGTEKWSFQLLVLCARTHEDSGQQELDKFIDKAGPLSVRQAIWQKPDVGLGDVDVMVTGVAEYHGSYSMVRIEHVGAALQLQVHAF
ncbi:hypothetical protein [Streptomyces roseolus]|uniref:hypothetical protein n=1 Tax=Streptomyces roseolus TaxID=67358 RepID=UPI0016771FF6|nr:hypothetical protein [Streptomyces roseolus]GGR52049.1 hypothetical protein GCM10010282_51300 [Streptomyces roseolus]